MVTPCVGIDLNTNILPVFFDGFQTCFDFIAEVTSLSGGCQRGWRKVGLHVRPGKRELGKATLDYPILLERNPEVEVNSTRSGEVPQYVQVDWYRGVADFVVKRL